MEGLSGHDFRIHSLSHKLMGTVHQRRETLYFYGYLMYFSHLASTWALQCSANTRPWCISAVAEGSIPADTWQLEKLKHWKIDFFMLTMCVIKNWKVDLKFLSASSGLMHFFSLLLFGAVKLCPVCRYIVTRVCGCFFLTMQWNIKKSVFLAVKWWLFCESHLLERHEVEITAWSAGVSEGLILLLVERNVTLGVCFLSYIRFKGT